MDENTHGRGELPFFERDLANKNSLTNMDRIISGKSEAAWQRVWRTLMDTAAKETQLGQVKVINDLPDSLEIFADPLITKVCNNLMDNAVRYGGEDHDHPVLC